MLSLARWLQATGKASVDWSHIYFLIPFSRLILSLNPSISTDSLPCYSQEWLSAADMLLSPDSLEDLKHYKSKINQPCKSSSLLHQCGHYQAI